MTGSMAPVDMHAWETTRGPGWGSDRTHAPSWWLVAWLSLGRGTLGCWHGQGQGGSLLHIYQRHC